MLRKFQGEPLKSDHVLAFCQASFRMTLSRAGFLMLAPGRRVRLGMPSDLPLGHPHPVLVVEPGGTSTTPAPPSRARRDASGRKMAIITFFLSYRWELTIPASLLLNCGAGEDSWTARSNQSIQKEINPEYSLEGLMLKLKLQHFGHLM